MAPSGISPTVFEALFDNQPIELSKRTRIRLQKLLATSQGVVWRSTIAKGAKSRSPIRRAGPGLNSLQIPRVPVSWLYESTMASFRSGPRSSGSAAARAVGPLAVASNRFGKLSATLDKIVAVAMEVTAN